VEEGKQTIQLRSSGGDQVSSVDLQVKRYQLAHALFANRETEEIMAPLEDKLKDIDNSIEDLLEKISNYKAGVIQVTYTTTLFLSNP
jgi:hypothetical protein